MSVQPSLSSALIATLADCGVERIFGIPGGGSSLDLIDAADKAGLEFVLTRSETAGALMAAVTGELTGRPGAMLAGIGPGAASTVNGVAYAALERAPLVLFTDGPAASLHQALDQNALFRPISKRQERLRPGDGPARLQAGIATALAFPQGPVQFDLTAGDAAAPTEGAGPPPGVPTGVAAPGADAVAKARALLAEARRPLVIAGLEARTGNGPAALRSFVRARGCPFLSTYKAKGVIPEDDPACVGLFTGAQAEAATLERADLILLYGLDPIEMIPGAWTYDAPILDLRRGSAPAHPAGAACRLVGALADSLTALTAGGIAGSDWTAAEIAGLRAGMTARLALRGAGHSGESVTRLLGELAPEGTRLTVDAGAHMFSLLAGWQAHEPFGVLKSNGLSTMGYALPAAIASCLEEPERPVLACSGDGGLLMCLSELTTAVERGCRLVVVVLNDAALSLIDIKQQRQQRPSRGVRYPPGRLRRRRPGPGLPRLAHRGRCAAGAGAAPSTGR